MMHTTPRIRCALRSLSLFTLTLVLATGLVAAQSELPTYRIVEIGTFGTPGSDTWSDATAINERGEVVGMADKDVIIEGPDGTFLRYQPHAFLYRNGELIDLGSLDSSYANAVAFDINNGGRVAGWSLAKSEFPELPTWFDRPVAWGPDGGIVDPVQGGTTVRGTGAAINDLGQMALNLVHPDPPPSWSERAHLWDPQNGLTEIRFDDGPEPGQFESESRANHISASGVVVGEAPRADGILHPFKYDPADGSIEDLAILGAMTGAAFGVNDHGDVAGWLQWLYSLPVAIVWTADGGFVAFADQLPETFYGWAQRVNSLGDVVGTDVGYGLHPWVSFDALETSSPDKIDLHDLLPEEDRERWQLYAVRDINDARQIVGVGVIDGRFRGFVMTPEAEEEPPSPAVVPREPRRGRTTPFSSAISRERGR